MSRIRQRVYEIVADPPKGDRVGNFVNWAILVLIAVNVTVGILETVGSLHSRHPQFFYWFEFVSVIIFTIEYVLRLWSCTSQAKFRDPIAGRLKMATRPMSVIDFLAIAPFWLQFLLPSGLDLRFIRVLRLFRLFRLFRMGSLVIAMTTLRNVFRRRKDDLSIALVVLLTVVLFSASLMYLAESSVPDTKFTSIPAAMWWAIITITTIGYGDIFPVTPMGQILGAVIGFVGVCVFALPVAIIGAGFFEEIEERTKKESEETEQDSGDSSNEANALSAGPKERAFFAEYKLAETYDEAFIDAVAERVAARIADDIANNVVQQLRN